MNIFRRFFVAMGLMEAPEPPRQSVADSFRSHPSPASVSAVRQVPKRKPYQKGGRSTSRSATSSTTPTPYDVFPTFGMSPVSTLAPESATSWTGGGGTDGGAGASGSWDSGCGGSSDSGSSGGDSGSCGGGGD